MGAEAALAFQAASGLTQAFGNFKAANTAQNQIDTIYAANPLAGLQALQQASIDQETALQNQQADLVLQEAARNAQLKAEELSNFRSAQAQKINSSGVLLEGSPLLVMNADVNKGRQEIEALMSGAKAQADLMRRRAYIGNNTGRAAILGSQIDYVAQQARQRSSALQNAFDLKSAGTNALGTTTTNTIGLIGEYRNRPKKTP